MAVVYYDELSSWAATVIDYFVRSDLQKMTSNRPYLIRAFYDWIIANGLTPYITVDATVEGAILPQPHVRDGQIVLNISPRAVQQLQLGDEEISLFD